MRTTPEVRDHDAEHLTAMLAADTLESVLFPPIEPNRTGRIALDGLHEMYWEESGSPDGIPALFLHGGPDIERLRVELGIDRWLVFGGSWGSTLALAYAEEHPSRCLGLVLRGIFPGQPKETDWFVNGLATLAPEEWRAFAAAIPAAERHELLAAYQRRLNDPDPAINGPAAKAWARYEGSLSTLLPNPELIDEMTSDAKALAVSRIEAHYFANNVFLRPGQLIDGIDAIRAIPGAIVQGRYDLVCPLENADRLHRAWPEADYMVVPDAGHSAFEPSIARELVSATNRMKAIV